MGRAAARPFPFPSLRPFIVPAQAQLLDHKDLSLATALKIATAEADAGKANEEARDRNRPAFPPSS